MRGLPVRLLLFVCLLASTAQGFVAQTHVHVRPGTAIAASAVASAVADAAVGDEPACILCEVAGHSPAVAPPSHAAVAMPSRLFLESPRFESSVSLATVASHHWRGRAPPTV